MTRPTPQEVYEATVARLRPALERVVSDPQYRERLEASPVEALAEVGVELDDALRADLEGRRFSEFWAERRRQVEGPVEVRDLPPEDTALDDQQLESVVGGLSLERGVLGKGPVPAFAPPYVPVGPVVLGDDPLDATPGVKLTDNLTDPKRR